MYLIEFDSALRADAMLDPQAASLTNVAVITGAQTTEVDRRRRARQSA